MVDARPCNVFVVLRRVRNCRSIIIIIIIIITLPACFVTMAASIAEIVQHRSDVRLSARLSRHGQRIHARKNRRVTGELSSVETTRYTAC